MKAALFLLLIFLSFETYSYVFTKNSAGQKVIWDSEITNVYLHSNLSGTSYDIFLDSLNQWNGKSRIKIFLRGSEGGDYSTWVGNGTNDIGFSLDPVYFNESCAVLGVTTINYDGEGVIREADILLNGHNNCFSSNRTAGNYLGNVITHELGHFIGLAHNEVAHSTMYYKANVGQYELSSDDKAGAYSMYAGDSDYKVTGTIVGGNGLIPVFGAHVLLISTKTGEVVASTLSESDGVFKIGGINLKENDRYYIYVAPFKNRDVLPDYYYNVRNNFCYARSSYVGAFYQACGNRMKGYPYAFIADSGNLSINTGNISIRCNFDIPDTYLNHKPGLENELDIFDNEGNIGESFVGFFSKKYNYENNQLVSIELEGEDNFKIDLSYLDFANMTASDETIYLEYRVITQDIFSKLIPVVSINGVEQNYIYSDLDRTVRVGAIGRVQISKTNPDSNVFNIKINPANKWGKCSDAEMLLTTELCSVNGYSEDEIFTMDDANYDESMNYFLDVFITKKSSFLPDTEANYTIISYKDFETNRGNDACPDAPETYPIKGYAPDSFSVFAGRRKTDSSPLACGTVDFDDSNGPGNNIFAFALGFLAMIVLGRQKRFKNR